MQRTQGISAVQLKAAFSSEILLKAAAEVLAIWQAEIELPHLQVVWNNRLRTSGGRALLREQVVELNPRLLAKNTQFIETVLIHELAHLVATARFGRVKAHGAEWQQLMIEAGQSPEVRHTMDASEFYYRRRRPRPTINSFIRRIIKRLIK